MAKPLNESQFTLAVQTTQKDPKLSVRRAASIINVPRSTLFDRIKGIYAVQDTRSVRHRLTELEDNVIVTYVIDLDSRGFAPRIPNVEDMANVILATRHASRVGTRWASNFIKRQPRLKTRLSRAYDY